VARTKRGGRAVETFADWLVTRSDPA
jgi:hypothetical protein